MNVVDIIGLVALLKKAVDTARYATAKQLNGLATQCLAWAAGVGGAFAVAQTQWASHITVGSSGTLAHQGALSLVTIGLAFSSSGSVLTDVLAAIDNTNTATLPPLLRSYARQARTVVANAQALGGTQVIEGTTVEQLVQSEVHKVLSGVQLRLHPATTARMVVEPPA